MGFDPFLDPFDEGLSPFPFFELLVEPLDPCLREAPFDPFVERADSLSDPGYPLRPRGRGEGNCFSECIFGGPFSAF